MKAFKVVLIALVVAAALSSCGIFKKDCGCPHFGLRKLPAKVDRA